MHAFARPLPLCLPLCLFLAAPAPAAAAVDLGAMHCSGTLTTLAASDAAWSCGGNFNLSGGSIVSDTAILLNATGSLVLAGPLDLMAPKITLVAQQIAIGNSVRLSGTEVLAGVPSGLAGPINAGTLYIGAGSVTIGGVDVTRDPGWQQVIRARDVALLPGGSINVSITPIVVSSVPEPSTWMSLCGGLLAMGWFARRRGGPGRTAGSMAHTV